MFGKKEASFKLSDSRKSKKSAAPIHEDLLVCREATDEQEELSDEDFLTENAHEGDRSNSKLDESMLNYSADTMTIGGNSSLGFSGNQGFFQNNLQNILKAAKEQGRLQEIEEHSSIPDDSKLDVNDGTLHFNLTHT